ncbi:MAG: VanW family protein [Candidatus Levybacteria bacterium]|nr:VanW family protein [Candidatus Levybacteria bacterium]
MTIQILSVFLIFFNIFSGTGFAGKPVVTSHEISLEKRYNNKFVNDVFKDNILLNLAYLRGDVQKPSEIEWEKIRKPFHYEFKLDPNKAFVYHDDVLDEYKGKVEKTTNAHFNSYEGFKSDGYLVGDGICHLASLIYWVARDANLQTEAPTNHDFAPIPQVPKEYGVSIYDSPGKSIENAIQNLYVTNNTKKPVEFIFDFDGTDLKVSVVSEQTKIIKS